MSADTSPIPQETLLDRFLPVIRDEGGRYRKYQRVHARPAVEREVIVSVTSEGEETRNTAVAGDMVVRNLTEAREEYLVGQKTFAARYEEIGSVDDRWKLYLPTGAIRAIEITREVTRALGVGPEFLIMAPWGSEQVAMEGDFLVAPLPELREIYRIGRSEFAQTYEPAEQ